MATINKSVAAAVVLSGVFGAAMDHLGTSLLSSNVNAAYIGVNATGSVVHTKPANDDLTLIIGGQTLCTSSTGIDGGACPDGAVKVGCGGDACSTPSSTASTVAAAINAQPTNKVAAGAPDGSIGYYIEKDAGLAGNVPITGTMSGTKTGMSGGRDPVMAGGPLAGTVANGFDPSVSGLIAPVGMRARSADGTQEWEKTGTGNTAWVALSKFTVHD